MIKRSIGSQATNNIVRMDLRIRAEISESFEESKKLDKVEIKDDLRFEIGFNEPTFVTSDWNWLEKGCKKVASIFCLY